MIDYSSIMYQFLILISFICIADNVLSARTRILYGKEIPIEKAPYQVSLYNIFKRKLICGGSIISSEYILTAGHCGADPPGDILVRAGSHLYIFGGSEHKVVEIIQHENYSSNEFTRPVYDIALMRVKPAFRFDNKTKIVNLPANNETVPINTVALVTGFGTTEKNMPSQRLLGLPVVTVDQKSCNSNYTRFGGVPQNQICATYPGLGRDFCYGDSGGPLVSRGRQIGIVSWSLRCARPGYPGVYTDVSAYRDWIDEHTKI